MAYIPGEPFNSNRLLVEVMLRQWKQRLLDTTRKLFTRAGKADA